MTKISIKYNNYSFLNSFSPQDVIFLVKALISSRKISTLDLSCNAISENGIETISEYLKVRERGREREEMREGRKEAEEGE